MKKIIQAFLFNKENGKLLRTDDFQIVDDDFSIINSCYCTKYLTGLYCNDKYVFVRNPDFRMKFYIEVYDKVQFSTFNNCIPMNIEQIFKNYLNIQSKPVKRIYL